MSGNSINLRLDKYQFAVDEKIKGTLTLHIAKAVKADSLKVNLIVHDEIRKSDISGLLQGRVSNSTSNSTSNTFQFGITLDTEKDYVVGGEYPFEMDIPKEAWPPGIQAAQSTGGIMGGALGMLTRLSPLGNTIRTYKVEGRLDIPWGIDVTQKIDITVS